MAPPSYKELIGRLPKTFGPSLNDQFRQWDLLFPAEQRQLQAQLDWLTRLPPAELKTLFAPIVEVESRMDLPRWQADSAGLTIHDVGVLARSPYYPQWRTEVEKVFGRIEDGVKASGVVKNRRRLILCILPAGLPLNGQPLWPELAGYGRWIQLKSPFGKLEPELVSTLAKRELPAGLEAEEGTWAIECGTGLSGLVEPAGGIALSWSALEALRREFLSHLNTIRRDIKSADQTTDELKRLDLRRYLSPELNRRLRVREFLRSLLLSGNGSLVFSNSFVQWGASEALRRAQPQVLLAGFGLRQKLKPFSSVVLFEDQHTSNPTPDQDDPAGSLVDALMLSQYVHLAAQGLAAYQGQTQTLFAVEDLDRVLLVGPKMEVTSDLAGQLAGWLSSAG